ncbi:MAG: hypothetical protein ABIP55_02515 [Tepidisphaeraceae bacterium]
MTNPDALPTPKATRAWLPVVLAAIVFTSLSLWAAVASQGFLEADSCTHYQYAKFALAEPHYFVNVWGRPFATAMYAVPATLAGRIGVRATSLVCALLIALVALLIARDQKYRWPALAFIFTLAQPLLFLHSFAELTELPFALLLVLAFWAYRRKQWLVMAILVALLPTARPEGFGFLLMAAVALVAHRRWWWLPVLPVALLAWSYAGWRVYGRPIYTDAFALRLPEALRWMTWLKHEWPYAEKSVYASGYLLHFIALLPAVVSPLIFPFVAIGVWRSIQRWWPRDHVERCQTLIAVIPLLILFVHSILYWLGRMASNGELRYMLVVAPFWALLAARGWEWTFMRMNWRHPFLAAGVGAVLPIAANFYYPVIPIGLTHDAIKAREVARWYRDSGTQRDYPRMLASNPEIAYFMGVSHTDATRIREWRSDVIVSTPPGTVLVWDAVYGQTNADTRRVIGLEAIRAAGWIERPDVAAMFNGSPYSPDWHVFVSPRKDDGTADERSR